jgi:DNA-binding NtrC family response regulator
MSKTILFAEYDDGVRSLYNSFLSDTYKLILTDNYMTAQQRAGEADLVVTSQRLYGGNAEKLVDYVRANYPDKKILILTSILVNENLKNKVNATMAKPFSIPALQLKLEELLGTNIKNTEQ